MKPLILVTNDDGITSPGIRVLVEAAKDFGNVVVVAPNKPMSAMGHAITIGYPLRFEKVEIFEDVNVDAYECSGTPADCVKLAKHFIMKDRQPDLVLSGVNHGSNTSISVLYSGTMSAAIEAAMANIPAIGFSLCDYDHQTDMDYLKPHIAGFIKKAIEKGIPDHIALNINFPNQSAGKIKGIKHCYQGVARWEEKFDNRKDPYGKPYFWMAGDFINLDENENSDEFAIRNGYITVVPCKFDLTCRKSLDFLAENWT